MIQYVDAFLRNGDRYTVVAKQFPEATFSRFLRVAIPTIYYAYSADTLKMASGHWLERAKHLATYSFWYPYASGEELFRKSLSDSIDRGDRFAFPFSYNADADSASRWGDDAIEMQARLVVAVKWDKFPFSAFRAMRNEDQAAVIRAKAWVNTTLAGGKAPATRAFEEIEESWHRRGRAWMDEPPLSSAQDSEPFESVFPRIAEVMFK